MKVGAQSAHDSFASTAVADVALPKDPELGAGRVAGQVALGILGTPVGFVAGGLVAQRIAERMGASEETTTRVAFVGAWTTSALTTAIGPTVVGSAGRTTGSYGSALLGAVAGGVASYGVVMLNRRPDDDASPCRIGCILGSVAVFVLPSVGATIGFNMSRRYER